MRLHNRHRNTAPSDAVYIGRGTPYGNPYDANVYGRAKAIALFTERVLPTLDLTPLIGKHLVCSCVPKPCHGTPILKALAAIEQRQQYSLLKF